MDQLGGNYSGDDLRLGGIRGWLAFFGVCLVLSVLLSLNNIMQNLLPVFRNNTLLAVYGYSKPIFYVLLFEILFSLLLFISLVFLCILFFMKSYRFPNLMFGYMIANCLITVIDSILVANIVTPVLHIGGPNILQPFIFMAIWGTYLKQSNRVRNTFEKKDAGTEASAGQAG